MIIGIDASRAAATAHTGTESYAYHLIRALAPLAIQRGHHLRLYFNQLPDRPLLEVEHNVVHIPLPRMWTHLRLAAELARRPPDLFFTPAHVIPYTYFGPAIATVHDLGFLAFPEAHTASQVRYLRWSTRHNVRRSRMVLADSEATRTAVMDTYKAASQKVHVVYPGVEPPPPIEPAAIRSVQERFGATPPYFFYVGTLQPRKNLERVVQAFAVCATRLPHQLVLAGKPGWLASGILAAIDAQPPEIRRRIILTGYVSDEDKWALLSDATALLFPSLYEGFGFPIVEAQACGVPVLTATNSSLPEVAGGGALLVEAQDGAAIADGMLRLASDEAERSRLIALGRVNARRFSWTRAAEKAMDVLEAAAR